jgi:hypothetical protein
MATSRGGFDPATITAAQCYAKWNADVACPNEHVGVIENLTQAGFGKFCGVHMDGYRKYNRGGEGKTWRAWTREEWEASGREAEHERQIAAARQAIVRDTERMRAREVL